MNKRLALILAAALILCGLAAWRLFGGENVVSLGFPTAATTGTLYPLGSAMASLWNAELPGVRVSAQSSGGGVDNLHFLREGEAQISMAVTSVAWQSYAGEGVFAGAANPRLRVLAGLYYNPNQIVVTAGSGIETLADIAGKRFAPGAPGSTTVGETELHLTAAGVEYPGGFSAQFVGFTEAADLMRNRRLDGAWIMAGLPTAAVTEICLTAEGRLVDVPEDVIAALQAEYPWYARFTIPAGTYANQDDDVQTTAVKMVLLATDAMDDALARRLVKTFWEHIESLAERFPALSGVTIENAVTDLAGIPLHDGAIQYYREMGVLN